MRLAIFAVILHYSVLNDVFCSWAQLLLAAASRMPKPILILVGTTMPGNGCDNSSSRFETAVVVQWQASVAET